MDHCSKTSFGYKKFFFHFRDVKLLGMKFKTLVDFASWNLLKEDDKVYEEEILEIKAKYGDAVTEDQIEGNTYISIFAHFRTYFLVIFGRKCQFFGPFMTFLLKTFIYRVYGNLQICGY